MFKRDGVLIPRLVHVVWVGPKPFPYAGHLASWRHFNPGWRVKLWTDTNMPRLWNWGLYERLRADSDMPYAVLADLVRLEVLARYGGLYSDADSQARRNVTPLVRGLKLFGMTGNAGNVANGTLGCTRGHPAMRALVDGAAYRYHTLRMRKRNEEEGFEVFDVFGTRYITPLLRSDPEFRQIDDGAKKGTRTAIAVEGVDASKASYIVHDNAVSWKKEGGTRLHLK